MIEIRIVCDAGENSTMKLSTAILDPEVFRQGYEILNASTLELTRISVDMKVLIEQMREQVQNLE